MVETAGLYLIPIKTYSKNIHGHLSLKWTLVFDKIERSLSDNDDGTFIISIISSSDKDIEYANNW
jgi:hypothetical protein